MWKHPIFDYILYSAKPAGTRKEGTQILSYLTCETSNVWLYILVLAEAIAEAIRAWRKGHKYLVLYEMWKHPISDYILIYGEGAGSHEKGQTLLYLTCESIWYLMTSTKVFLGIWEVLESIKYFLILTINFYYVINKLIILVFDLH
jgi:hypothetical protein